MTIVIIQHSTSYLKCICDSASTWLRYSGDSDDASNWVNSADKALLSDCSTPYTGTETLTKWCSDVGATIHSSYSIKDYPEYFI